VTAESSTNAVTVLLSTPGSCNVQDLAGKAVSVGSGYEALRVRAAHRTLAAAHCRIGTITRARSDWPKGYIDSQRPEFGTVLPRGAKVDLVVSR
jgi:beta-lactam-binding protein with PASTA domain